MKKFLLGVSAAAVFAVAGFVSGIWISHNFTAHQRIPIAADGVSTVSRHPFRPTTPRKRKILYWWDPMLGPSSISSKPGISAMGMKLVPVYAPRHAASGGVVINPIIEQDMGVQTAVARVSPLTEIIPTVGYVRRATPQTTRVVLRISGYIGRLYANTQGQTVHAGDIILTLYSPQLLTDETEMLSAYHMWRSARRSSGARSAAAELQLFHALVRRLINLGVPGSVIQHLVAINRIEKYLPFVSPASGEITEISIRQKSFVRRGQTIMQVANLSSLWIDAHVYDQQMSGVRIGDTMRVSLNSQPGRIVLTKVNFISPSEGRISHSVVVRGDLSNASANLMPGMTATVYIHTHPKKSAILIPRDAVIETGTRNVVFVAKGHGHFYPVRVRLGLPAQHGMVAILAGIAPGQRVVTSGEFLIDVESQMRTAESNFALPMPTKIKALLKAGRANAHLPRMSALRSNSADHH